MLCITKFQLINMSIQRCIQSTLEHSELNSAFRADSVWSLSYSLALFCIPLWLLFLPGTCQPASLPGDMYLVSPPVYFGRVSIFCNDANNICMSGTPSLTWYSKNYSVLHIRDCSFIWLLWLIDSPVTSLCSFKSLFVQEKGKARAQRGFVIH